MAARIFMLLITTTVAKHHHGKLVQNNYFFASVYTAIHSIINDLFESIDLDTNFMNQSNTISLLTMHQDLKNIVDIAIETYNVIQNITNDKSNQSHFIHSLNETEVNVTDLDTLVNEVLNKKNFDVYRIIKGTKHKRAKDKDKRYNKKESNIKGKKAKSNIKPAFENSEEFKEFVIKFSSKVNNLTINDFKRSGNINKYNRFEVPLKKNLKAWNAPSSLIFDLEENDTRRIFRGSKTHVNSFPFMVSIHIMGEFTCSGCIISRDFVITAASCLGIAYTNDFVEKNLKSIYVRLVSDQTTSGGETIPVENLYFHPQFNPRNLQNNLAIIRMEKRIRFSKKQKKIRRILWDKTPGALPNETKQILILGWGPSKKGQVTQKQPKLRVSMLDVYNTTDCRKKYTENFIAKENFCAAYNGTNGSACNGDVGGPAIVGGILMGVVSFGAPECGAAGEPTVFTKLGYYVPWIENVMNAHKKRNQSHYDNIDTRRKNKHSSKKRLKDNKTSNDKLHVTDNDYPDEELAIKEALLEVINDEQSLVHDVLYGDLYDEFSQFFKPESNFKKNSIRTKKQKTNQLKPKEETDFKNNTIATEKQRTTQPTTTNLKFDLESDSEHSATTEIAIRSTVLDIKKGDSEYETDNDSVQKDYSDNYEKSSKEERGLSIEIPTSTTKKSLRNKENTHGASSSSNSESKTDQQVSDESTDYSKEIREFFDKTRNKSKNKKYSKKRSDTIDSARSILENGREKRTREVLIKLEHFSKQARSVLDEGKAFATKTFIFDFEPTDVLVNKDKPKFKNSKSERDSRKNKDIVKSDKKIPQSIYLQF